MDRIMNENSLNNLKAPKEKKDGYGYRYTIPQEKIDELFSYLAEGMSLKKAAKETNICFETARKYFKRGDPKRGIKPLQMRLEVFQEKISEKMNVLLQEQVTDRLKLVRGLLEKAQNELLKDGTDFSKITIRDIERLIKLEAFLCGGIKTTEREAKMLTADEISGDL